MFIVWLHWDPWHPSAGMDCPGAITRPGDETPGMAVPGPASCTARARITPPAWTDRWQDRAVRSTGGRSQPPLLTSRCLLKRAGEKRGLGRAEQWPSWQPARPITAPFQLQLGQPTPAWEGAGPRIYASAKTEGRLGELAFLMKPDDREREVMGDNLLWILKKKEGKSPSPRGCPQDSEPCHDHNKSSSNRIHRATIQNRRSLQ